MKKTLYVYSLLFVSAMGFCGCSKTPIEPDEPDQPEPVAKIDSVYLVEHFDNMDNLDSQVAHSVSVLKSLDIHFEKIGTLDHSVGHTYNQGCSIYDGILFQCYHTNDIIDLISMDDLKRKETILLEPETIIHCNDVSFGGRRFNQSDPFPVLYIQQRGYANTVNAYHIKHNQDYYDASLVQTVSFEPCNSSVSAIDTKNNLIFVIYNTGKERILASYDVPSFNRETVTINLLKERKSKPFILPMTKVIQDMTFFEHYLFVSSGYSGEGEIWIIDVTNGVARKIDLVEIGLKAEPEGLSLYDGKLFLVLNNFNCYTLDISSLLITN